MLLVLALLLAARAADAALTTGNCLALKRQAWGNLRKCESAEQAKTLKGKPADLAKCQTKLQEKLAKITAKATEAGITCRYGDNGDFTVMDYDTGLQWERKSGVPGGLCPLGSLHCVNDTYSWGNLSGCPFTGCANGEAFSVFLARLNSCTSPDGTAVIATGFAGHCDWRLPTIQELSTIVDVTQPDCDLGVGICIDPIFGGAGSAYWSGTTASVPFTAGSAWALDFSDGVVNATLKPATWYVRAVRTGQ
jgi:hypothetical protein